ncbi:EamA family transporter [soil metagenome]
MSARAWIAFGSVSVLWGIPYLFSKSVVDDGVPPAFLAWARVTLAAAVLLGICWRLGLLQQLRGHGRWLVIYAVIEIVVPFPMIAGAEQRISSSLAAILIASVPLIVAVLAIRFDPTERVHGRRLIGLLIGFAGVITLVGIDVAGNSRELLGAGMIFVAALGYAAGPMILGRQLSEIDPRALMAGALSIAAVILTPAAIIAPPAGTPSAGTLAALVFLGLVCTALAFVLFATLIGEVGAGRASVITYVAPVVAVAAGIAFLDERPGAGSIAGLLLIIAGSWLSTDGRLPPGLEAARVRAGDRVLRRRRALGES